MGRHAAWAAGQMDADLQMVDLEFEARAARLWPVVEARLGRVYGGRQDLGEWLTRIAGQVKAFALARPPELRLEDRRLEDGAVWWREGGRIGYACYVDRFAGGLAGLERRLGYLGELGVDYLHLLPLMRARTGENDGGFAVSDFTTVDPRLGSTADLVALARAARGAGIRLVLDLVCNHTADDHAWALAAKAGDPRYRDYYRLVPDQEEMRRWEAPLVDVFPETAPGSFTWSDELGAFVWTTFYPFQWDLNYANPAVFSEMLGVMLALANLGVDGFRLDSAPFLWKRAGTDCRNQPEAHDLLAAWRALLSIAAPAVALKAEAIERPDDVLAYFGSEPEAPECDLAYANGVMTALWASLALGSARPAARLIEAAGRKPARGTWANYVRCHDDIIWSALTPYLSLEEQARCSRFFAGEEPSSFASGRAFQGAAGAPPSTNGMTAALVGISGDEPESPAADRLRLLYGVAYALDGVPIVWMGDEIGLGDGPSQGEADSRWLQRPEMDWVRADRRADPSALAGRIFARLAAMARLRGADPAFGADHPARVTEAADPAVLSLVRGPGAGRLQCLANFSGDVRSGELGLDLGPVGAWSDLLTGDGGRGRSVELGPWQVRWVVAAP